MKFAIAIAQVLIWLFFPATQGAMVPSLARKKRSC